jgi:hypothetical protein
MIDDRRAMYDGFSDKGAHSAKWVQIVNNFLNLSFAGARGVVKCQCKKYHSYKLLS